jgi:hemolysin-activating ACP:hemolysin acyltransferase
MAALPSAAAQGSPAGSLRLFKVRDNAAALGLTVDYLMNKPAFADLKFGEWSQILVGQINRDHYWFITDAEGRIQGFVGWALAVREKAEAWVEGRSGLRFEDSTAGDCVICNAWAADSTTVHHFMVKEMKRLFRGKALLYFKRHYTDGRKRPTRLSLERMAGDSASPARG